LGLFDGDSCDVTKNMVMCQRTTSAKDEEDGKWKMTKDVVTLSGKDQCFSNEGTRILVIVAKIHDFGIKQYYMLRSDIIRKPQKHASGTVQTSCTVLENQEIEKKCPRILRRTNIRWEF